MYGCAVVNIFKVLHVLTQVAALSKHSQDKELDFLLVSFETFLVLDLNQ